MSKIADQSLYEAYDGYYDDELDRLMLSQEDREEWCYEKAKKHSRKERLEVYTTWNGIIGHSDALYDIATSDLAVFIEVEEAALDDQG